MEPVKNWLQRNLKGDPVLWGIVIVFSLISMAVVYSATGTLNLAQLGQRLPELDPGTQLILQVMLLLGFGTFRVVRRRR